MKKPDKLTVQVILIGIGVLLLLGLMIWGANALLEIYFGGLKDLYLGS